MSTSVKQPLIVQVEDKGDEKDAWIVYPTPGLVAKFRGTRREGGPPSGVLLNWSGKLFVNLAHCVELSGPSADLDEDEVAKIIRNSHKDFKIPISIGELDEVEDKKGEIALKVDVIVNSIFFNKRIQPSKFFRDLTLLMVGDALAKRHGIHMDTTNAVILRNKKVVGELGVHRIHKRPRQAVELSERYLCDDEVNEVDGPSSTTDAESEAMEVDDLFGSASATAIADQPRNYRVQIVDGTFADIRIRCRDADANLVTDVNRITLKMNDDRCAVLLDSYRTIADFFLPYRLLDDEATCEFEPETATLIVKCPVDWNH